MIKSLLITLFVCVILADAAKRTSTRRTTSKSKAKDPPVEEEDYSGDEVRTCDDKEDGESSDRENDVLKNSKSKSKPSTSKKPGSKSKSSNASPPSLICVVFSNIGCGLQCIMLGALYDVKTKGSCSSRNVCNCTSTFEDDSLEALWDLKFTNSNSVLRQIKKSPSLSRKIRRQLLRPFRTAQQSKQDLQALLTPDQFRKLRVNDATLASRLAKPSGLLDYDLVETYILAILRWILPSPNNRLRDYNYQAELRYALKSAKNTDTVKQIVDQVRRSKNKKLAKIVDEYVLKRKLKEKSPLNEDPEELRDIVSFAIIDEFVDYIEYHTWLDRANQLASFNPSPYVHFVPNFAPQLPPPPPAFVPPPPPPPPVYLPPVPQVPLPYFY